MLTKFLDPKNDVAFRRIFGTKKNKDILEEELLAYEQAIKQEWDYAASMEQKYDEGIAKGIEKGREEEKIDIAQKLLTSGMEAGVIAQLIGLPLDKIQLLARKNPS
jgi:predicted transposase YdaD